MKVLPILLLAACSDGANEETLVDELRVLAIQGQPPEAAPGEDVDITVTVADPVGGGADVLVWHCTNLGDGCLEEGTEHAWTLPLVDHQVTASTVVPEALAAYASDEPFRGTLAWALACEPGVCPQIDDPYAWDLADPTSWVGGLPLQGVSLAFTPLAVSTRTDRVENPVLTAAFDDPIVASAGEQIDLVFDVDLSVAATAESLAFGYATGGGFEETEYTVGDDGQVTLTWFAPEEAAEVTLYVIVNDGVGGVGVWFGDATAE